MIRVRYVDRMTGERFMPPSPPTEREIRRRKRLAGEAFDWLAQAHVEGRPV